MRGSDQANLADSASDGGLPSPLRAGIEVSSGMDMSSVPVHRNSTLPAQLNALAYAQGNSTHLGPGQERYLPHEAWHVVQQRQGRVPMTTQVHGTPINDDRGLEREADHMGAIAATRTTPIAAQPRAMASSEHPVLQAVWNTPVALDRLLKSANGATSRIVPVNIELQQEARDDDGGKKLRESQNFSAVDYEFEFAQLAPDQRLSNFGTKSHLHLATSPSFPLHNSIPFAVETDMGAAIELAMPPLLIPRDPKSKRVDQAWVAKVMLKLERGLRTLARNSTQSLVTILKAVQLFFGLQKGFRIDKHVDVEGLGATTRAAKYGHMEKNSRFRGKHITTQANIVTTLREAIGLSAACTPTPMAPCQPASQEWLYKAPPAASAH